MCYYKWDKASGAFVESSGVEHMQAPAAGPAATGAAGALPAAGVGVSPWQKLIDPSTNAEYYYNSATGQSQWTPPPELVEAAASAPATLQGAEAANAASGGVSAAPTNGLGAGAATHASKKKQTGAVKMKIGLALTGGKKARRAPALQAFGSIEDVAAPSAELQEVLRKQAHRAKVCDHDQDSRPPLFLFVRLI